jgi:DDE superfamily endonuclease
MSLVASFVDLVQPLSWAMSTPVFKRFVILLTGWIFAPRRTITGMLVAAGVAGQQHHAAFHRVFSKAHWSLDQLGLIVFVLLKALLPEGTVELSLDDTEAHKRGRKVYGVGMHHDPQLSTRKQPVLTWGHSWVILSVIVRLSCCPGRVFSLPILFRLYLNHDAAARARRKYRSHTELAVELLHVLCAAHPGLHFHLFADTTYGGESVLGHLPINCDLTSRLPMNARLYDAPPPRKPGARGRPRKRGARLPTPAQMLQQRARRVELDIYGRKQKARVVDMVARWHNVPVRPLRVVAVEPLRGGRGQQAFYSTRIEDSAEQALSGYSDRWSIEEAFAGGKGFLGFEDPQSWSRLAVLRTAPIALLLYSLIVLWFERVGQKLYRPLVRPWYPQKERPSFADMLRTLRRQSLIATISAQVGPVNLPQNLVDQLIFAANAAP